MNHILHLLLTGSAIFWTTYTAHAATYIVDPGSTNLGYDTVDSFGTGLDGNFDNVLFTATITGATPISSFSLSLAADGAGPGNYAILSGATYLVGSGVVPTNIQLNLLNGTPGDFYQSTFTFASPSLSAGLTTATLVLEYPLNSIAPLLPGIPFVLSWPNQGATPSASTISVAVPEPSSNLSLGTAALIWGSLYRRKH